jgi:hypothetical protein
MRTVDRTVVIGMMGAVLAAAASAVESPEPPMVELERSGPWRTWQVKVFRSGRVVSHYNNPGIRDQPLTAERRLDRKALSKIQDAIRQARFLDLPDVLEPVTVSTDDDSVRVTVRVGERVKSVYLTGIAFETGTDQVGRFRSVWGAVDRLVPEPR